MSTKKKKKGPKAAKTASRARARKRSGSPASKTRASSRASSRTDRVAAVRTRAKEVAGRIRAGATDLLSRVQQLAKKYRRR